MIDLRSDTVTKPSPEMRAAMAAAEVGDDVYGEDPTVNRLQDRAAEIFEKEAALFVPTGSMGNQLAVKVHTRPGDEIVIEERGHIFNYELAAPAAIAGVLPRPVRSADGSGHLTVDEAAAAFRTDGPYYSARTGLLCLENTHNFAGGSVMSAERCAELCAFAQSRGVPVHMDGARIFNAAATLGRSIADLTRDCSSVMFTLSKGLGAPAGSVLLGSREFIAEARIWRKRLGGGMRQIGILAAAGLLALADGPARLHKDHENARRLRDGLTQINGITAGEVVTNIVIFSVAGTGKSASEIVGELARSRVLAFGFGDSIRMVLHRDVSAADVETTIKTMRAVCG